MSRSSRISSDFQSEKTKIREKYSAAGYPTKFTESVIRQFEKHQQENFENDENIIPTWMFEEERRRVVIEIPFCNKNEVTAKRFLTKLKSFTNVEIDFIITWKTTKVKSLFNNKDKNPHPSNVIYEGVCTTCECSYIGETKRNAEIRWKEHANLKHNSEPARHINEFPTHQFEWKILLSSQKNYVRKALEAYFIKTKIPSLNEQTYNFNLILFRNGVTFLSFIIFYNNILINF